MRFLADENFPGEAIRQLAARGHDVVSIGAVAPGMADADVVAWAAREGRIIVTFDKDFGELVWRAGLPPSAGIVLFRVPMPPAGNAGADLATLIDQRADWAGHFSVIDPGRVRMRPLAQ